MALVDLFDGWTGDQGAIYCEYCYHGQTENCRACNNARLVMLEGTPADNIVGDLADVYRAVSIIVRTIQHEFPRGAMEYISQPAKWIAAYEFLAPFAVAEIDAKQKREQARFNAINKSRS